MSIQSPSRIEFYPAGGSGVMLVEAGGWLVSLPRFDCSQQLFELDGVGTREGHFKPLGNAVVSITFEVERDEANPHDAFLQAEMESATNLVQVEGALVIISNGDISVFEPAVIVTLSPGLPVGEVPVVTRVFSIQAALPVIY